MKTMRKTIITATCSIVFGMAPFVSHALSFTPLRISVQPVELKPSAIDQAKAVLGTPVQSPTYAGSVISDTPVVMNPTVILRPEVVPISTVYVSQTVPNSIPVVDTYQALPDTTVVTVDSSPVFVPTGYLPFPATTPVTTFTPETPTTTGGGTNPNPNPNPNPNTGTTVTIGGSVSSWGGTSAYVAPAFAYNPPVTPSYDVTPAKSVNYVTDTTTETTDTSDEDDEYLDDENDYGASVRGLDFAPSGLVIILALAALGFLASQKVMNRKKVQ